MPKTIPEVSNLQAWTKHWRYFMVMVQQVRVTMNLEHPMKVWKLQTMSLQGESACGKGNLSLCTLWHVINFWIINWVFSISLIWPVRLIQKDLIYFMQTFRVIIIYFMINHLFEHLHSSIIYFIYIFSWILETSEFLINLELAVCFLC